MYSINSKKDFQNSMVLNYFSNDTVRLEDLSAAIRRAMHLFETLKVEVITNDGETEIKFIELDSEGSTLELTIYLDSNNIIKLVERENIGIITQSNKTMHLFLGSLINKKIIV